MESDHALSDLVQLFWQIRKTMQTSIQQAYPDRPRSELAMLERLHYIIRQNGQDGAVPVSALPDCLRMLAPPSPAPCGSWRKTGWWSASPTLAITARPWCA